jgi:hypothetical protein
MEKDPILAMRVRELLGQQVGRENDREVIADLLRPSPALSIAPKAATS